MNLRPLALAAGIWLLHLSSLQAAELPQFEVRGVLREWDVAARTVTIEHEEIPGYMPAMTMPFATDEPLPPRDVKAGERITFRLTVTAMDGKIDRLRKASNGSVAPAAALSISPARAGDSLPNCQLIDQTGRQFALRDLFGAPFALTFIFTRCPLPNFCPLLNARFQQTQRALQASAGAQRWRLLSVSIDPEYDTPSRLQAFSAGWGASPDRWTFATGEMAEIRRLATACGVEVVGKESPINHRLRTLVVDAGGRLARVFNGSDWPVEALVEELHAATRATQR